MQDSAVSLRIVHLDAQVSEGVTVQWQGRRLSSGPLNIELDRTAKLGNDGELDYGRRRARANFNVLLAFPEFASLLDSMGVQPDLWQPVRAAIFSEGQIVGEHGLRLSGRCQLDHHALLSADETRAFVLPVPEPPM